MIQRTPLLSTLFLLVFATALTSCHKRNTSIPVYDPEFVHHISAFTSGVVSKNQVITIVLKDAIDPTKVKPSDLQNVFEFSPPIKGLARWNDERTISFTPSEPLSRGTIYMTVFNLGKLKKVQANLKKFPFRFETKKPGIWLGSLNAQTYPDQNYRLKFVECNVSVNDVEDLELVKSCITANYQGKPFPFSLKSSGALQYVLRMDSLPRGEENRKAELAVSAKPMGGNHTFSKAVIVHGLGNFRVTTIQVENEPDQKVHVYFSDNIAETQNLQGLLKIDDKPITQFSLNGNKLTFFPENRLVGQHNIQCAASIRNYAGFNIKKDHVQSVNFQRPKPKLRLVGNGTIVPGAKGVVFPFEAMGLKAVDVWIYQIHEKNIPQFLQISDLEGSRELSRVGSLVYNGKVDLAQNKKPIETDWNRYTLNLNTWLKKEPGAIYRVLLGFRQSYTYWECEDEDEDEVEGEGDDEEEGSNDMGTSDRGLFYDYYNNSLDNLNSSPCNSSFYYRSSICRNILASDVGIIAKQGKDGITHLIASNLLSSEPLANAKVTYYSYNNQVITTTYADEKGMISSKLKVQPYLVVVTSGNQRGYLKLGDGRANSTSTFDVEGLNMESGIDGKIYTERGVWRPGDSMYICFTLFDRERVLPSNVPVRFTLENPQGQKVSTMVKTSSVGDVYDFRAATDHDAVTGNYRAIVQVGDNAYYKTIAVETVQPNRLKIRLESSDSLLSLHHPNKLTLSAAWLHGAPANGLDYNIQARLRSTKTQFKGYEAYTFEDHLKESTFHEMIVATGKLDDASTAEIEPTFELNQKISGMLKVDFITKVFEKSGNFSTDQGSYQLSPYTSYIGIKSPKTTAQDNSLETDKAHRFEIVNLSDKGKVVPKGKVGIRVYRMSWRWWWDNHNDVASYMQSNTLLPLLDSSISVHQGKGHIDFKMPYPNWGRFLMVVTDPISGHTSTKLFYVDWPYWRRSNRGAQEQANTIALTSNKSKYNPGDLAQVTLPTAEKGKALVCVENGSKVLKKFWVNAQKGETKFTFKVDKTMTPNVYVHVSYMQPYSQVENDLPARMYGILPIFVEDKATRLEPVILVKDEIRPDRNEVITVKESTGQKMTYTLAVVDEGLLDLTHFKTPKLWNHFYQKQGLGVKTWDLYDQVMSGYEGKWGNVLSVGGDEEGSRGDATHKASRFKPAVRFFGPFTLDANGTSRHLVSLGSYIGAVRVMLVARNNGAFGSAEKSVKVKKPIMLVTTVPRVLSAGERIAIPVNVFSVTDEAKKVEVTIKVSGNISTEGETSKTIRFTGAGDEVVDFYASIPEMIGKAKIVVTAVSGNEKAVSTTEVEVRAPNPLVSTVDEYAIKSGGKLDLKAVMDGLSGTNTAIVEYSSLPPINLQQRINQLIQYPHGCVEQTTSSVFAQMFIEEFVEPTVDQKKSIHQNVQAAIHRLRGFQTSDGGLGYWLGARQTNAWGTNYAGHFITCAKQRGYSVAPDFYDNWLTFQQNSARNYSKGNGEEEMIQAYRLYTMALAGKPDLTSMNRMREGGVSSNPAKWKLAAAYILAGMPEVAENLSKQATTDSESYLNHGRTYGSQLRDDAMILETIILLKKPEQGVMLLRRISEALASNRWMSTQETAYALISLAGYHANGKSGEKMSFTYTNRGSAQRIVSSKPIAQMTVLDQAKPQTYATQLHNTSTQMLFVRVIKQMVPLKTDTTIVRNNLQMSVHYVDFEGFAVNPAVLVQGQEFKAIVKIKNPGTRGNLQDMALNHLIAGGWEIQNARLTGQDEAQNYTYRDIRDDRVYTYFDLNRNNEVAYTLNLTATYAGKFYLPAVVAESMYDHSVMAKVPGQWVEVHKKEKELGK
ncbi:MAG: hypothetical protein ACI8ZN_002353 [Bacteroidia bacterium]|jgi:uncharacterized protein YfaS (alpha-2-macroglobulin family)/disulfide oxidoreductase YuzD